MQKTDRDNGGGGGPSGRTTLEAIWKFESRVLCSLRVQSFYRGHHRGCQWRAPCVPNRTTTGFRGGHFEAKYSKSPPPPGFSRLFHGQRPGEERDIGEDKRWKEESKTHRAIIGTPPSIPRGHHSPPSNPQRRSIMFGDPFGSAGAEGFSR